FTPNRPWMPVLSACDVSAFIVGFMPKERRESWPECFQCVSRQGLKGNAPAQVICLLPSSVACSSVLSKSASRGLHSFSSLPLILYSDYVERICFNYHR
ncbi:hypothetical protein JI435_406760, partial [Parastagonospora nodorum SN15]